MTEGKKFLSLLQVSVPPETALTVTAQVKILEMLGFITNGEMARAIDMTVAMIPANTTGTLYGFLGFLENMIKNHPDSNKAHHDELVTVLKDLKNIPDINLTYGMFLPICDTLLRTYHHHKKQTKDTKEEGTTKPRSRSGPRKRAAAKKA